MAKRDCKDSLEVKRPLKRTASLYLQNSIQKMKSKEEKDLGS